MAAEPQSGIGIRIDGIVFCTSGVSTAVYETDLINRTAVVRDSYARWCEEWSREVPSYPD